MIENALRQPQPLPENKKIRAQRDIGVCPSHKVP